MRIIAGQFRGRGLRALKGSALRPTSDQMRETLFDVLGDRARGACFLDLYAGSGAVGIEALSRGAGSVVFVEQHRPASEMVLQNLAALGIKSNFRLITSDASAAIERLASESARFEYIFLDPPYAAVGEYHRCLREIARAGISAPESVVIAEHSRHCNLEERYGALARFRLLRHGDSQLAFYRIAKAPPARVANQTHA
ncbi:MAG: 16S rRNA (guanine(966)-N(2))-methyltransferase RsmD [Terriglobia bacterium]